MIGLLQDERVLLHDTGFGHPERADRIRALQQRLAGSALTFKELTVAPARREDVLRVHQAAHLDRMQRIISTGGVYPDPDTPMGPGSLEAAFTAAGAAIEAARAVWDGEQRATFSMMRPPGHHAEADRAMGFCLINNVAVAAHWLLAERGAERLAILDFDVHHGNGTQNAFYDEPRVLYVSMHEFPHYPGTGHGGENGFHENVLNVPLGPYSGEAEWLAALDETVLPKLQEFRPELLLLSSGFDAHRLDPLSSHRLESESYAKLTQRLGALDVKGFVSLLEGGYHIEALGDSTLAHLTELDKL